LEGARRKVAIARRFAPRFGIGTECGMGRYFAPELMPEIFDLHQAVAQLA
jgi:hypothetical protein